MATQSRSSTERVARHRSARHPEAHAAAQGPLALVGLCASLIGASACGGGDETIVSVEGPLGADFVSVHKALEVDVATFTPSGSPVVRTRPDPGSNFYLAIKKSLLGSRWFLSAYVKQFYPDGEPLLDTLGINGGYRLLADSPLGTRVVTLELQNDRLFVFDASDRFRQTPLQDPRILLEAYPVVERSEFSELPGSEDYVLVDPSLGLNDFSLTGVTYADPQFEFARPLDVGLAFSQNFQALADGAAFEQVFSGDFDVEGDGQTIPVWGTLGIALRRYVEGSHYVPTPPPARPFYIAKSLRLIPDGTGRTTLDAIHWDVYPGMQPIEIFISAGAYRAQADLPNVDVLGALTRGIESWNEVFGFRAFTAVLTHDDHVPDDSRSFVLVDYPGPNGTSHGEVQSNPNTGEIRAANIYYAASQFYGLIQAGLGAPGAAAEPGAAAAQPGAAAPQPAVGQLTPPRQLALSWAGMGASSLCDFTAAPWSDDAPSDPPPAPAPSPVPATVEERAAAWLQSTLVHEMGHALGLRHNFKGSLLAPGGSSIMDYQTLADTLVQYTPGSYDVAAIYYLYGLSTALPEQPFCTDGDLTIDPTCAQNDQGAAPLADYWGPIHASFVASFLSGILPATDDTLPVLNNVLGFARDPSGSVTPEGRVAALRIALGRSAVPLSAEDAAVPSTVAAANELAAFVLHRALLDPPGASRPISQPIRDAGVVSALVEQAGLMLLNADGVRSFPLRRVAVDVLAVLQTDAALAELLADRDALAEQLAVAEANQVAPLRDLLARVDAVLSPYYQ